MFSKVQNRVVTAYLGYLLFLADPAQAQDARGNLRTLLTNGTFAQTITLGFAIYTAFKWFDYFNDFKTGDALRNLIVPAVLTFLTFQWSTVLRWVGIIG